MHMKNYELLMIVPRENDGGKYRYSFPLGLAYISAVLKNAGYSLDCLNLNHFDEPIENLIKLKLDRKKYDFILTGSIVINYAEVKNILMAARSHNSKPRIILGGLLLTSEPELIFNDLMPDFGVIGEGEETILELLDCLKKNGNLKSVAGLIYCDSNGKTAITPKRKNKKSINDIPFPDMDGLGFAEMLNHSVSNQGVVNGLFDNPRIYPIMCSRSCPFQCTFCWHACEYRTRTIDNIMEELESRVKKYKINTVILYDDCFVTDKRRLTEFCRRISKLREELPWDMRWYATARVEFIDGEVLKMMKNAGCFIVSYGFESYDSAVLKSMKKNITPEQIDLAFKMTMESDLAIWANFIFGDKEETKESAYKTLEYWKKNCMGQVQLWFIQPYPDCELWRHCIKKGLIKNKLDYFKNPGKVGDANFNMSKMTDWEIKKLGVDIAKAMVRCRKVVVPCSVKKIKKDICDIELNCPFCKKRIRYGNCYIPDKKDFIFMLICKNCYKRFLAASRLRKFLSKNLAVFKRIKSIFSLLNHRREG